MDYDFTARLEDELDAVSRGEEEWIPLLKQFWSPFKELIDHTQETVKRSDVTHEALEESCPQCGKPLSIRLRTPWPLYWLQQLPRMRLYPGSQ